MINGLWGRKIGMTQVFTEQGSVVPVTVIDVGHWIVTQMKTKERDGYDAVQLGCVKSAWQDKPFEQAWLHEPKQYFSALKEVFVTDAQNLEVGKTTDLSALLVKGDAVDVFGTTIGRGFQGGVKRHGFAGGPATHGDNLGRGPGSMGFMRSRGRVIKGWRMAGHMGVERQVMKNLEIIRFEPDAKLLLIKGSVPGKSGSLVYMRKR